MFHSRWNRAVLCGLLYSVVVSAAVAEEEAPRQLKFFRLEHASAPKLVELLTPFFDFDSLMIGADPRTNMVIAKGGQSEIESLRSAINVLDTQKTIHAAEDSQIKVFSLVNANAVSQATNLELLLQSPSLRLVPDADSNSILARGPEADLKVVEAILLKLDSADGNQAPAKVVTKKKPDGPAQAARTPRHHQLDGSVRMETVEGTDTFIIRGKRQDVEKALQLIKNIEDVKTGSGESVPVQPRIVDND